MPTSVKVRLYGPVRDAAGASELELALPDGARVSDLKRALAERLGEAGPLEQAAVAVDGTLLRDDAMLGGGACDVLPPVAGG